MKKVAIFVRSRKDGMACQTIRGENVEITIFEGELNKFFPTCGSRYHTIYVEGCFNTKENQEIIRECIRPAACLAGGEGVIFI